MATPRRRNSLVRWAISSVAVTAVLAFAQTATAKVIEQQNYSGTDSFSFDDCGFTLNVEESFSGNFHLRVDKGGQAFLVKDTFSFRDVVTNPETGEWFVIRGHGLFHEVQATQVSGTIYEFTSIEAVSPL